MAVRVHSGTGDLDLTTKGMFVRSWHWAEDAGAPAAATVLLRNGSATGDIYAQIELAASSSDHESYAHPGLPFPNGLFIDVAAGNVRGSVDLT